jgi:hypothetical protein
MADGAKPAECGFHHHLSNTPRMAKPRTMRRTGTNNLNPIFLNLFGGFSQGLGLPNNVCGKVHLHLKYASIIN